VKRYPAQPIPLLSLKTMEDQILIRPVYQRNFVWPKDKQEGLLDTILKNSYIPEVVWNLVKNQEVEAEVIDGQQRLITIFQFLNNELKIGEDTIVDKTDLSGMYYKDLPPKFKTIVDSYTLNVVKLEGTRSEIEEMFRKLQSGIQLNKVEFRHALSGSIQDYVRAVIKHPFFVESVKADEKRNKRMKFNEVVEQLLLLELFGISDIKDTNINKMYREYNDKAISKVTKDRIKDVLDYLHSAFGNEYSKYFKKTTIHELYLVLNEYIDDDPKGKNVDQFARWWVEFQNNASYQKTLPIDERDKQYGEYLDYMSGGTGTKQFLEGRKTILLKSWLEWLEDVKSGGKKTLESLVS
jgi:hypothetical protein